jgi:hypothetical protein
MITNETIEHLNNYNEKLIDEIKTGTVEKSPVNFFNDAMSNYDRFIESQKTFQEDVLNLQHRFANHEIEIIKKIESQLGIKI